MRFRHLIQTLALTVSVGLVACDDDHDHDHGAEVDTLVTAVCAGLGNVPHEVTADTDASSTAYTATKPDHGGMNVTLTPGQMNYVWVKTENMHTDAALFANPSGVVVGMARAGDGAEFTLTPSSADCDGTSLADYRVHLHEPEVYRIALDGNVAGQVWLDFRNEASDHSGHSHDDDHGADEHQDGEHDGHDHG